MKDSSWGFVFTLGLLVMGVSTMAFSTWLWANLYDWPEITRKLDRLAVLERQADAYQAMEDANIGVWCELAVHYDWLEEEDREQATLIIQSKVHDD